MKRVFIIPAPGRAVPDPDAKDLLPATGREVPRTAYWVRRLSEGDVVEKPAKPIKPAKPTQTDEVIQ